MKKILTLILLCFFLVFLGWYIYKNTEKNIVKNETNIVTPKTSQDEANIIAGIQKKVQSINAEEDYQTKTLNNEEFLKHATDGGGQLTGIFINGQISKISKRIGLSHIVTHFDYYFWDNQLILVNEKEEFFPYDDNTGTMDYTKLELGFEGYYYFNEEKLIKTEITGEKRYPEKANTNLGLMLLSIAKKNIELLSK